MGRSSRDLFSLWLGTVPALLQAFFEQMFRPNFTMSYGEPGIPSKQRLGGKSARIVVTMGMPAFFYRWFYLNHSVKSLQRNMLGYVGIGPIRTSLIGMVETGHHRHRERWLEKVRSMGQAGR